MTNTRKIIIGIAVMCLILIGMLVFQKKDTGKNLPVENVEVEKESNIEEISNSDLVYYKIPEMGIKFKVKKELAEELIYFVEDDVKLLFQGDNSDTGLIVYFSTKKLAEIDDYCSAENGPLGSITRVNNDYEKYKGLDYYKGRPYKDFDNFFILYGGSQAPCTLIKNNEEWEKSFEYNERNKGYLNYIIETVIFI